MAQKKNIEEEYKLLGIRFLDDMYSLVKDFIDISGEKRKKTEETIKSGKKKESITKLDRFNIYKEIKTTKSFQYAMFTYLYSTYEKHVSELIEYSYLNNKNVQIKYEQKFWEYNNSVEPIANQHYSQLSPKKQKEFLLSNLWKVLSHKDEKRNIGVPSPLREHYLFDIPDKTMWDDKGLKIKFKEIVARRNLLTHRNDFYDDEYIFQMTHLGNKTITKSKQTDDPKDIFSAFVKKGYYYHVNENKIKKLEDLIKNKVRVIINGPYFLHSAQTLIRLYTLMINQVFTSIDFTRDQIYELNMLYSKTSQNGFFASYAFETGAFFKKNYIDRLDQNDTNFKKDMDLLNANILIAHINWLDKAKELNVKKDSSNYKVVIKNKQFLIDSFRPKKDLEEVGEHMLEWPMFHNLFQRKDFKEAFMKKLKSKKKDKIPIYQMLVAIAEGRDKDCISLL